MDSSRPRINRKTKIQTQKSLRRRSCSNLGLFAGSASLERNMPLFGGYYSYEVPGLLQAIQDCQL